MPHAEETTLAAFFDGDTLICLGETQLNTWWTSLSPEAKAEIYEGHLGPSIDLCEYCGRTSSPEDALYAIFWLDANHTCCNSLACMKLRLGARPGMTIYGVDGVCRSPMRVSDLTNTEIAEMAQNHRGKGNHDRAGLLDELLDRRADDASDVRVLERSLAFERASGVIESECVAADEEATESFDLSSADLDLSQEIDYLDSRRLLLREDPTRPHIVTICDEEEPLPESEAACG